MKKLCVFAAVLMLTGCSAQEDSSSVTEQTTAVSTTTTTSASTEVSSSAEEERETVTLTADVLSYDGSSIKVSYEGAEYDLDLSECEYSSAIDSVTFPNINGRIINNPFGIKTSVILKCDPAFTKAYWCDAVSPNGSISAPVPKTGKPENELPTDSWSVFGKGCYSVYDFEYFEVTEKGKYQGKGRIDLSACDLFAAPEFKEGDGFNVMCFKFKDEDCFIGLMTYSLFESKEETKDKDGNVISVSRTYFGNTGEMPVFFGTVTEVDEKNCKVTVKLGSGAVCTLTPSVTIGCYSLEAGDKVAARFTDQINYPDDPKQTDFDFAVIEKTDGLTAELVNIVGDNIYAADGDRKITVISDNILDAETLKPITDKNLYSKIVIEHGDISYAISPKGSEITYVYYASSVKLER